MFHVEIEMAKILVKILRILIPIFYEYSVRVYLRDVTKTFGDMTNYVT